MFWSTFTAWFLANQTKMPRAEAMKIKREALARFQDRLRAGYADSPLTFDDLIKRGEDLIAGAA